MQVRLILQKNIFSAEKELHLIQKGETVENVLKKLGIENDAVVFVNGNRETKRYVSKDGDEIIVRVLPENMDAGDWMMIAGAIITVGAIGAALLTGGLSLTALGWGVGLFVTGLGIDQGWFVPKFDLPKTGGGAITAPTGPEQIRGTRNQLIQGAPVPIVLGKHWISPLMVAKPEIYGANGYKFRELFIAGYGPLRISDVRIGETVLYSGPWTLNWGVGYKVEGADSTLELRFDSNSISVYPYSASSELVNEVLTNSGGGIVRTTATETDFARIMILFPSGLMRYDDKNRKASAMVEIAFYRKPAGTGDENYVLVRSKQVTGKTGEPYRYEFVDRLSTRGQYTYKVVRVTADRHGQWVNDYYYIDQSYVESITSEKLEDPISSTAKQKVVRIGLEINEKGDWGGVIDRLSCVAESIVPVYSGSGSGAGSWTNYAVSSNPAALYLWLLRGPANPQPVEDEKIDWAKIEEWYQWCATQGYQCNAVINSAMSLIDALTAVAATGRASPLMIDGKYSVVIDKPTSLIVQQFTARNVSNFRGVRAFRDIPHAIKCKFVNEQVGYKEDMRIVYADGYNSANATKFETIELWGITNPDQVYRFARYRLAEAILRPEVFSFSTDWEHIVCTRGDRVKLSHDVILVGLAYGRIKQLLTSGNDIVGFVGDEAMPMEDGKSYAVRIRTATGLVYKTVQTVAVEQFSVSFDTPATGIAVGDLYSFGEAGIETIDCLVVSVVPKNDYSADVLLVEYNEAIYTADTEQIPAWTSNVSVPADGEDVPGTPTIVEVRSDGTALQLQADGTWVARILVTFRDGGGMPADKYECQYRVNGTDAEYKKIEIPKESRQVWIAPVEELFEYEIRLRAVTDEGLASGWSTTTHTVQGKLAPPSIPASVTATVRGVEGIEIIWDPVEDLDVAGYEVRVGTDWDSGTEIFNGQATRYLWQVQTAGSYKIMVKAVDVFGNKSTSPAETTAIISEPGVVQNLTTQVVDNAILIGWGAPATGSLPVAKYEIYRGTDTPTDKIAELTGTYIMIAEADIGTYRYWVRAVDVAGNVGDWADVNASVVSGWVSGTTAAPAKPVILAVGFVSSIAVYIDKQATLAGQCFYHVQVSEDQINWYEPRLDGVNWRYDTLDGYATVGTETYWHTNIPYTGTEEDPQGRTLYYRVRRVKQADPLELSDWSDPASATTRPVENWDIAANEITAEKLYVENIAAITGNLSAVSGGGDDPYNYWVLDDYPGRPTEKKIGMFRAGLASNYLLVNPQAGGTEGDPYIQLVAGDDYIKLTDSGIVFRASTIKLDSLATRLKAGKLEISDEGDLETGLTNPVEIKTEGSGSNKTGIIEQSNQLCFKLNGVEQFRIKPGRNISLGDIDIFRIADNGTASVIHNKINETTYGSEYNITTYNADVPRMTMLQDGRLLCVYRRISDNYLLCKIRETDGTWGSESVVVNTATSLAGITTLQDGRVLLVYTRTDNQTTYEVIRNTNGTWGTPVSISLGQGEPSLCVLTDGSVLSVYRRYISGAWKLCQRIRSTNGTWGSETVINNSDCRYPNAVRLPDNTVVCIYFKTSDNYIYQMVRDKNGYWSSESLVASLTYPPYPVAVLAPDNRVVLYYQLDTSSYTYLAQRIRDSNGNWSGEYVLTTAQRQYAGAGVTSDGKIILVYQRSDGSNWYLSAREVQYSQTSYYQLGAGIVEEGKNSNGSWVKFSNGMMMCWNMKVVFSGTSGGVGWTQSFSWTFPYAFADTNLSFSVENHSGWSAGFNPGVEGWNTTSLSGYYYQLYGSDYNVTLRLFLMAIGRWK